MFEVGTSSLLCPDIIYEAIEMVRILRDRLKTDYSWQMSNADNRITDLQFEIDDHV